MVIFSANSLLGRIIYISNTDVSAYPTISNDRLPCSSRFIISGLSTG